jgi:hypothetical protein
VVPGHYYLRVVGKQEVILWLANCYFGQATGHVHCYVLSGWLVLPYVHPLNVADFEGIRAG